MINQSEQAVKMDVVFLVDATGSMSDTIASAHQRVVDMAQELRKDNPGAIFRFGSVCYRDPIDEQNDVHEMFQLSSDVEALRNFFGTIQAYGGGDGPEDFAGALEMALNKMDWSENQGGRSIVMVSDAPAHCKQFCGFSNHEEEAGRLPPLIERVAREKIFVTGLSLDGGADLTFSEFEKIYTAAGGLEFTSRRLMLRYQAGFSSPFTGLGRSEPFKGRTYMKSLSVSEEIESRNLAASQSVRQIGDHLTAMTSMTCLHCLTYTKSSRALV